MARFSKYTMIKYVNVTKLKVFTLYINQYQNLLHVNMLC